MSALDVLLLTAFASAVLLFAIGAKRGAGHVAVGLFALQGVLLVALRPAAGADAVSGFAPEVLGNVLHWRMTGLGWYFAVITVGAALFSAWFGAGAWGRARKDMRLGLGTLALNVCAMLVLLASGDLLSLFIGWELVSWAGFLLMVYAGGKAGASAYRYILYAMSGAMAVFVALVALQSRAGSLGFEAVQAMLRDAPAGFVWINVALLGIGFGIKMALVPVHLWQAEAYANSPGPAAAFLGAISSRMGLFALAIVLVQLVGIERLAGMAIPLTFLDARELWAWVAAITIVVPTFIALTQTDARLLLAWHGIGQGGYMLLGLVLATPAGMAGGLLHVFNHASYQAPLFLGVAAVAWRTGTTDLDQLGGLVSRMPLTFLAMLLGIMGLAGLPPMNGFVSKWLVYKSLLEQEMPLLFVAALLGTLGTVLSVYKLIHNTFLGQLRLEHREVREVPASMTVPMLVLGGIALLTGCAPGLALALVESAQLALGVAMPEYGIGGVALANARLDMLWVGGALTVSIGIGAVIFHAGNRAARVHQYDNYAGGHFLSSDVRYQFSHDFYPGLMRVLRPWLRGRVQAVEHGLVGLVDFLGGLAQGMYRAPWTPVYLIGGVVVALFVAGVHAGGL